MHIYVYRLKTSITQHEFHNTYLSSFSKKFNGAKLYIIWSLNEDHFNHFFQSLSCVKNCSKFSKGVKRWIKKSILMYDNGLVFSLFPLPLRKVGRKKEKSQWKKWRFAVHLWTQRNAISGSNYSLWKTFCMKFQRKMVLIKTQNLFFIFFRIIRLFQMKITIIRK